MELLPNDNMSKRFKDAYDRMKEKDGEHIWRLHEQYRDFPDMARFVCEIYFDEIGSREVLDAKTKETIIISLFFVTGIYEDPMFSHLLKGIECGLSIEEIRELALLSMAYSGAPNATTNVKKAIARLEDFLINEKKMGIQKQAVYPNLKGKTRQEFGQSLFADESGEQQENFTTKYRSFEDLLRVYVEFVYGDLKSRQILDEKKKQLAILSMLCATKANDDLIKCQVLAAKHAGCSFAEFQEVCMILAGYLGFPSAFSLAACIDETVMREEQNEE